MNKARIACYKRMAEDNILLSGVTRKFISGLPMGSPVLLILDENESLNNNRKFYPTSKEQESDYPHAEQVEPPRQRNAIAVPMQNPRPRGRDRAVPMPGRPMDSGKVPKGKHSRIDFVKGIKELLDTGNNIADINRYIREDKYAFKLIIPFPQTMGLGPTTIKSSSRDFFYTGKVPIINDKGVFIEETFNGKNSIFNSSQQITEKIKKEFIDSIIKQLTIERFININLLDIKRNTQGQVNYNIQYLMHSLTDKFKYNTGIYFWGQADFTLLDTISISFYSLEDIIPMFVSSNINGLGVELTAFNSYEALLLDNRVMTPQSSIIMQTIFADDSEGIIEIDGENINYDCSGDAINLLGSFINYVAQNTPYDYEDKRGVLKNTSQDKHINSLFNDNI